MAQRLKHLPAMQETWVRSLGREGPLEKEMATHSSILAWRIPWMEKPGKATVHGVAKSQTRLSDFGHFTFPVWNQSAIPSKVLTCFLTHIQVSQEIDKVVWYSHLFKNFP